MANEQELVEVEDTAPDIEETEDGGAIVRMEDNPTAEQSNRHFANIVEEIDRATLSTVADDLLEKIERDKEARSKRDKLYEEGLRRTGLGDDAPGGAQFSGASRVVHPMLIEACVDFSARAMKELFPPNGPVKAKVLGEQDRQKLEKAEHKSEFMNWQCTEQMPEFLGELEQLTTQLPLGGGQYFKIVWNNQWKRAVSEFVPIDDIYLPFAATNFYTAERKTHVQYITKMEYQRRVKVGMYTDVDLPSPEEPDFSLASRANDKIEGRQETSYNEDGLRTIFEVYTHLALEDDDEVNPYIISIDKSTDKVLAVYRNWEENDPQRKELEWIVEFPFVPWRGAYPIGLTHMIGGLSGAATGSLRALLDSAHIQNIPTMLKLKGGPNGQSLTLQPTEIVEIEGGLNIDDVRKIAMPVPFNPPSQVLMQLLGFLIEAGKGVVQTSFEKLSDQNPNQPVGTTVALIEQGMVVFSSIHSRLHASMGRVLKVLHRINSAYLTEEDIRTQLGDALEITPADFDGPMDVVPVSNPSIFSDTQRFAQIQAIMQRSAMMPQMYNPRKIEEMFLEQLKVSDDILAPKIGEDDRDPISENMAAVMGQPVYVLPKQDHIAHLKIHMGFVQSPLFGTNPVLAKTGLGPLVQHLRDHLLNYYMVEAHKGVAMAMQQGIITEDAQQEAAIVLRVQQVIEQELGSLAEILPKLEEMAQQFAPPQTPPDSSMAVAQLNAQTQQAALQQRAQTDQANLQYKMQQDQMQMQQTAQSEQMQLQLEQAKLQLEQTKMQQAAMLAQVKAQQDAQREQQNLWAEQTRQQAEDQRTMAEIQARMAMNTADNETAKELAAAEIASGEKVSVSTGTGINPNP